MNKDVNDYMSLNYPLLVWQEDDCWFAKLPLLPGILTHAKQWEDLPARIHEAQEGWLLTMLAQGNPIPEPERTQV